MGFPCHSHFVLSAGCLTIPGKKYYANLCVDMNTGYVLGLTDGFFGSKAYFYCTP